jgi:hypothetical protein
MQAAAFARRVADGNYRHSGPRTGLSDRFSTASGRRTPALARLLLLPDAAIAFRQWSAMVLAVLESPRDPRTVADWSRLVGASQGSIKALCRRVRCTAKRSLDAARTLRALCLGHLNPSYRPSEACERSFGRRRGVPGPRTVAVWSAGPRSRRRRQSCRVPALPTGGAPGPWFRRLSTPAACRPSAAIRAILGSPFLLLLEYCKYARPRQPPNRSNSGGGHT